MPRKSEAKTNKALVNLEAQGREDGRKKIRYEREDERDQDELGV